MPAIRTIAPRPAATCSREAGVEASPGPRSWGSAHRPLLELDDLDALPEWQQGHQALLAFVAELNLPGGDVDSPGPRLAQWLHSHMLISVELAYGIPVIVLQDDQRRAAIPLADADIATLRTQGRRFSS